MKLFSHQYSISSKYKWHTFTFVLVGLYLMIDYYGLSESRKKAKVIFTAGQHDTVMDTEFFHCKCRLTLERV